MTKTTETIVPLHFVVRLNIHAQGEWFSITCDVCRRIIISGDAKALIEPLSVLIARIAPDHMHAGM